MPIKVTNIKSTGKNTNHGSKMFFDDIKMKAMSATCNPKPSLKYCQSEECSF